MPRRPAAVLIALGLLVPLLGCVATDAPPPASTPTPAPTSTPASGRADDAGRCLDHLPQRVADDDDLIPCTEKHWADIVSLATFPGMPALLGELPVERVWEALADEYQIDEVARAYNRWAERTCGTAFREAIGWDDVDIRGADPDRIDLRPGGAYEIVAAVAGSDAFAGGDHQTRCLVAWSTVVAHDPGVTIADMVRPGFTIATRECWIAGDDEYLDTAACDEQHTDQVMLEVDAFDVFGSRALLLVDPPDEALQRELDDYCADAVEAAFGAAPRAHYVWGSAFSLQWSGLRDAPPEPTAFSPLECFVSSYPGTFDTGDLFDLAPNA